MASVRRCLMVYEDIKPIAALAAEFVVTAASLRSEVARLEEENRTLREVYLELQLRYDRLTVRIVKVLFAKGFRDRDAIQEALDEATRPDSPHPYR